MPTCPFCNATERQQKKGRTNAGTPLFKCVIFGRQYALGGRRRVMPGSKQIVVISCAQCGRETTNPKFCSKSCAAIYNNMRMPKRKKQQKYCRFCGTPVQKRSRVCDTCNPNNVDRSQQTIGDIQKAAKYQVSALLRHVARQVFKQSNRPRICQNCGYDKHVEICHIQGINTFSDDTPVAVVSGLDNLVALCPNCHWEFDKGLLKFEPSSSPKINEELNSTM